ncbi:hypothetical protein TRAPUB_13990 [Trametes pubescens]|uniref:Uncharacterized protein n=1 Tax=Trametes pubescens TaxID=154538 RepID=A0A1M2VPM1_TRAPU|nr:hypothetical protein TRAPUB_13990 [Trametes pubescens]
MITLLQVQQHFPKKLTNLVGTPVVLLEITAKSEVVPPSDPPPPSPSYDEDDGSEDDDTDSKVSDEEAQDAVGVLLCLQNIVNRAVDRM